MIPVIEETTPRLKELGTYDRCEDLMSLLSELPDGTYVLNILGGEPVVESLGEVAIRTILH